MGPGRKWGQTHSWGVCYGNGGRGWAWGSEGWEGRARAPASCSGASLPGLVPPWGPRATDAGARLARDGL
eukprot:9018798-Alexandrium_andersonii.AAC.1